MVEGDNYEKTILSLDKMYITDYEGIKFENIINGEDVCYIMDALSLT